MTVVIVFADGMKKIMDLSIYNAGLNEFYTCQPGQFRNVLVRRAVSNSKHRVYKEVVSD